MRLQQGQLIPSEDSEQFLVVDWLRRHNILFHHSPNGGKRHITTAMRLKRQGTQPGFPDLIILDPPPVFPHIHSVAIEMKRKKGGKTSDEQKRWLTVLEQRGWYTAICNGGDEAIKTLERLGYGKK